MWLALAHDRIAMKLQPRKLLLSDITGSSHKCAPPKMTHYTIHMYIYSVPTCTLYTCNVHAYMRNSPWPWPYMVVHMCTYSWLPPLGLCTRTSCVMLNMFWGSSTVRVVLLSTQVRLVLLAVLRQCGSARTPCKERCTCQWVQLGGHKPASQVEWDTYESTLIVLSFQYGYTYLWLAL